MIILDTSVWIWWISDPDHLSHRARSAIQNEEDIDGLIISAISVWEVALKHRIGKLKLNRDIRSWIALATAYPGIRVAPLEACDALESTLLPGKFHNDPADRFIVTLALRLGVPVATSDRKIINYKYVKTVW